MKYFKFFILLFILSLMLLSGCTNYGIKNNSSMNKSNETKSNEKLLENELKEHMSKEILKNGYKVLISLNNDNMTVLISTQKPTLGYTLNIDGYKFSNDTLIIYITINAPDKNCFVGQTITEIKDSITIKLLNKMSKNDFDKLDIEIKEKTETYEC